MGNAYLKISDIDSAEENYIKAFTLRPKSSLLQVNFGTLAIQKNEWHLVQYHFREALKIDPMQDRAWTGLAIYHNYMGDRTLALANLKKALDINIKNRTALLLFVAWQSSSNEQLSVIERLAQYLDICPDDEELTLLFIEKAQQVGFLQTARLASQKLVFCDPKNSNYNQIYKEIYYDPKKPTN